MAMKNELILYNTIQMPRGLVVIGDAVQRLNAIYGQGIGVSAQSVVLFRRMLDDALLGKILKEERREAASTLGWQFQNRLAGSLRPAWSLATKADLK